MRTISYGYNQKYPIICKLCIINQYIREGIRVEYSFN